MNLPRRGMKGEGGGNVIDLRCFAGWQQDFYHIHTTGDIFAQPAQPELGHAPQQLALVFIDSACRASCTSMQGALHLDKNQQVVLAADNIHLATGPQPETAPKHLVTLRSQP